MPTSIIDGTVEEATLKWSRRGISYFDHVRFRLADGSEQTIKKPVVKQEVAGELTPGAKGRFYAFKAFDIGGIHGVRIPDGRSVYAFPNNNQKLFLISGSLAVFWIVLTVLTRNGVPLLGVGLVILSAVGWHFMGKGQSEAKAQFDADAGYRPGG